MAKRQAQARSISPSGAARAVQLEIPPGAVRGAVSRTDLAAEPIERAEERLAECVKTFTEASEALRAEIKAFDASLAMDEGRSAQPDLQLVVSRTTAEVEAVTESDDRPTPAQIAEFVRVHEGPDAHEPRSARAATSSAPASRPRNPERERLYADVAGAVIGLSAAVALINLVL